MAYEIEDGGAGRGRPIEILLVEDSPADARLTREGLKDAKIANNLHVVTDGRSAIEFLARDGAFADAPRPELILLDLNLPGVSGHDVLEQVKGSDRLSGIPVVILTSSAEEEDVVRSYELKANAYITKPVDFDQFTKVIRSIEDFWLSVVRLPEKGDGER